MNAKQPPESIDVPRRFAQSTRLQSLYKSGYQDALDGRVMPAAEDLGDGRGRRGDKGREAYRAGYKAASTWLSLQQEVSTAIHPTHPTGETDPYWLPIWQWDTEGGSWEATLDQQEDHPK